MCDRLRASLLALQLLRNMTFSAHGLRWHKLDLHVHTPASKDYTGPALTADEFVAKVISKGITGVAITDHNSGAWIDAMKQAASGTDLVVFPGVEISVTGGKSGIHIIALFDLDATTKTIENLLATLRFDARDYGDLDAISPMGPDAVVNAIHEAGALPILAHADSSKGVLSDMSGMQRTNVMNSRVLGAVEVTNPSKTAPLLSGNDSNYRRKLAYYRASDNRTELPVQGHSVDGVGSRYSWFKTDGLSLDALRQAFADPDIRIRCDTESPEPPDRMYPRIRQVRVSEGFLKGMIFEFHEGLNSIIGGKGVGKSVLIELMRFALDQASVIGDILGDMEGKLSNQLGLGGQVSIRLQLEADQLIDVTRTFNGHDNPIEATYVGSNKKVAADVPSLFPVLAYSQTETLEIAKDQNAQLTLIDSFLELAPIESRIDTLEEALNQSDQDIANAIAASEAIDDAQKNLATHDEKVASLERALKSKELDALTQLKPKTNLLGEVSAYADEVEQVVDGLSNTIRQALPPKLPESLAKDRALARVLQSLAADAKTITQQATKLEEQVEVTVKRAREAVQEWDSSVDAKKKEYQAFVKKQGGDRPALLARKEALEKQRPSLVRQVTTLKGRAATLPQLRTKRVQLLAGLAQEEAARHELRKTKYAELTAASKGRLDLSIARNADTARYAEALKILKTGSRVQDATIDQICAKVSPDQLLSFVDNNDPTGLSNASSVQHSSATNLINHLSSASDIRARIALQHGRLLLDNPRIRFRKDDGNYYDLSELSIGQKCTALLIIALAEGTRPVIIDQPEDALDITSIYEDVTLQLRGRKHTRQFILTTHNPTVAVASDTDQFHVLTATASRARLATDGAIDRPVVRAAVIQHLEGGAQPFALKTRKYGLPPA